jgi:hypothetical protein
MPGARAGAAGRSNDVNGAPLKTNVEGKSECLATCQQAFDVEIPRGKRHKLGGGAPHPAAPFDRPIRRCHCHPRPPLPTQLSHSVIGRSAAADVGPTAMTTTPPSHHPPGRRRDATRRDGTPDRTNAADDPAIVRRGEEGDERWQRREGGARAHIACGPTTLMSARYVCTWVRRYHR